MRERVQSKSPKETVQNKSGMGPSTLLQKKRNNLPLSLLGLLKKFASFQEFQARVGPGRVMILQPNIKPEHLSSSLCTFQLQPVGVSSPGDKKLDTALGALRHLLLGASAAGVGVSVVDVGVGVGIDDAHHDITR